MRLTEEAAVPLAALPLAQVKEHLRLGSGFALAPDQDALIESQLRAAIAAIEGRIAKALVSRRFLLVLQDWRDADAQALPLAPVTEVVEVAMVTAAGAALPVAPGSYRLIQDQHRPKLVGTGASLPAPATGGRIEIRFDAGFGPDWTAVPKDLHQAVMLLAARYYDHRDEPLSAGAGLPASVAGLIEGWRQLRILGGGRR